MNYEIFQAINNLAGHHPLLDPMMVFVTEKALLIFAFVLFVMWVLGNDKFKYTVIYAALTGALGLLINFIIGHIYFEPRPFVTHHVHMLIPHAADASFPSDHTTGAFALAIAILLRHRKLGIFIVIFAALTGISRIYVGHHYPFDVLGSIVVGILTSIVVYKLSPMLEPIPRTVIDIYNKIPLVPKNKPRQRSKTVKIR
ncbi:undecaprenyl-diphosphatase [Bacillus sp. S/N-304-OC-R1]|uniref:undecaprenyl-diphosphatase n=1 Tax=Bacillus sp. S/N-304-OC-R1 TaxID=2758034 RepID=UPI001C8E8188|nr:undecaprenyl-diphosphatase [Bacillus sp. S/N-304-OC-R1]MBY0123758.1 undecaprenyl-diphosphatase [Bacillus sp. S/N-304-OC-R1]